jgi:hypothetical protein
LAIRKHSVSPAQRIRPWHYAQRKTLHALQQRPATSISCRDIRVDDAFDAADRESLIAFLKAFEDVRIDKRDGVILIRMR